MLPFELTKDTPYLALSGELWSVFYEYFNRNWSCYKGFLLYHTLWTVASWYEHDEPMARQTEGLGFTAKHSRWQFTNLIVVSGMIMFIMNVTMGQLLGQAQFVYLDPGVFHEFVVVKLFLRRPPQQYLVICFGLRICGLNRDCDPVK